MAGEAKALSERTRQVISQMVYAVFVPLFFASIGMKIDFIEHFNIFLVLLVSAVGILGRFYGAWLGVNLTNQSKANRMAIAVAHTPGGAMEIVVGVLALEYRLITESVFIAIIFGAVVSSIILGPWLNDSIKRRKEVSILEFFSRRMILEDVKSDKRDSTIVELCQKAVEEEDTLDIENLSASVLLRENAMGTAIEEGIAMPHAFIDDLTAPMIVFGRSLAGIDWNSPDGKLTHFIFLVLIPLDYDIHVQILGIIAHTLSEKRTRDAILHMRSADEIWGLLGEIFSRGHVYKGNRNKELTI
jgi:mannitol/fructose-specific phosphotransferase system IIA component (Ntr-type)